MSRVMPLIGFLIISNTLLPDAVVAKEFTPLVTDEIQRDYSIEKAVFSRSTRLKKEFHPSAKAKLDQIANELMSYVVSDVKGRDISLLAQKKVRRKFRGVSPEQFNLLYFYVLSETSRLLSDYKNKHDGMNEMSEMTSLRLQMTMDRRSKFMSTLSNIMKKISSTQDVLVQNIK